MTEKVFLSYAQEDSDFAKSLASDLKNVLQVSSENIEVIDGLGQISAGENIRKKIKAEMNAASTVVIVSSDHSDDSQWVNYEAGMANALGKNVVIVSHKGRDKSALLDRYPSDNVRFVEVDR